MKCKRASEVSPLSGVLFSSLSLPSSRPLCKMLLKVRMCTQEEKEEKERKERKRKVTLLKKIQRKGKQKKVSPFLSFSLSLSLSLSLRPLLLLREVPHPLVVAPAHVVVPGHLLVGALEGQEVVG